jgi:hypothetical protein
MFLKTNAPLLSVVTLKVEADAGTVGTCGGAAGAEDVMVGARPEKKPRSAFMLIIVVPGGKFGGVGGGTKISVTRAPAIGSPAPARVTIPSTLAVPPGCCATRVDSGNAAQESTTHASRTKLDLIGFGLLLER